MSLCARVEQNGELSIHGYDNLQRTNTTVTALVHLGQESKYLDVTPVPGTLNQYQFTFSHSKRGVAILEVFFDGVQIPESPFRIEVTAKDCPMMGMVAVSSQSLVYDREVQEFENSSSRHHRTKMVL